MNDGHPGYEIADLDKVAETPDVRVRVLTLAQGQCVPWHRHTRITDTFFCLQGPMVVQTRNPDALVHLNCGESTAAVPGQAHRVSGRGDGPCRFLVVQGVGEYDYLPED